MSKFKPVKLKFKNNIFCYFHFTKRGLGLKCKVEEITNAMKTLVDLGNDGKKKSKSIMLSDKDPSPPSG